MRNLAILCLCFSVIVAGAAAGPNPASTKERDRVTLEYMGAAEWRISDGTTIILIDPYLSRILGPPPPLAPPCTRTPGDMRPVYGWDDVAVPDVGGVSEALCQWRLRTTGVETQMRRSHR